MFHTNNLRMVPRNNTHLYDYTFDRAIPTVRNLWNILLNCWLLQILPQSSNLLSSFAAVSFSGVIGVVGEDGYAGNLGASDQYTLVQCPAHRRANIQEQPFTPSHNKRLISGKMAIYMYISHIHRSPSTP